MGTWHIHIKGRVQGVGFRPFIYNLATSMNIRGTVNNGSDGVHIELDADSYPHGFIDRIKKDRPKLSVIQTLDARELKKKEFEGFILWKAQVMRGPICL